MPNFFSNQPATTTQTQSSTTQADPWAAAKPLLNNLVNSYGGVSTALTPEQQAAGKALTTSAAGVPNLSPQATADVQQIFQNAGMLPAAYQTMQRNLGGVASSDPNPWQDPGVSDQLAALQKNITNTVKGTYAASGRDPSGAGSFGGSLATGLAQGLAPTVMNQYNADLANKLSANQMLENAGIGTSSGMTSAMLQALQGAGALPGIAMAPAAAQWGAANAVQAQPVQNINELLAPAATIGGMGGTTTGTGTAIGTQTPANNATANILGLISGAAGLVGASDRRLKTDIKDIGRTHDNQKIYSYRFKGSNLPQIGMMADEIEKKTPQAVAAGPDGYKRVRYDLATRKAAKMGMLKAA